MPDHMITRTNACRHRCNDDDDNRDIWECVSVCACERACVCMFENIMCFFYLSCTICPETISNQFFLCISHFKGIHRCTALLCVCVVNAVFAKQQKERECVCECDCDKFIQLFNQLCTTYTILCDVSIFIVCKRLLFVHWVVRLRKKSEKLKIRNAKQFEQFEVQRYQIEWKGDFLVNK